MLSKVGGGIVELVSGGAISETTVSRYESEAAGFDLHRDWHQLCRSRVLCAMAANAKDQKLDDTQHSARWRTLFGMEQWLETPMMVLSLIWVALLVLDLTGNSSRLVEIATTVIWVIFIAEFGARLLVAPEKLRFLKRNILTLIALVVPALRLLRALTFLRAVRVIRGVSLVRVVGGVNRGMNALRRTLRRRAFGYVISLTLIVLLAGAAGMYSLEPAYAVRGGFADYWDALWWTGMLLTSIGSQYWPQTTEARVLGFMLALYGLGVLGYLTATIASFFIGRDAERGDGEVAGSLDIKELRDEIIGLREELRRPGRSLRARRKPARRAPSGRATKGRAVPSSGGKPR